MQRFFVVGILLIAGCSAPPPPVAAPKSSQPAVNLNVVKWLELEKALAAHRGKIVVMDIWAEY